jgi:hypothetical protein
MITVVNGSVEDRLNELAWLSMTEAKRMTLGELIGRNLREYRAATAQTQDHLAGHLRARGLMWTRTQLAKVERGERDVGLGELFALIVALEVAPAELLSGERGEWVMLTDHVSVSPGQLALWMSPKKSRLGGDDVQLLGIPTRLVLIPGKIRPNAWPDLDDEELDSADVAAGGDAERKAAERLGVDAVTVARAALVTWRRGLVDERDARVMAQVPKEATPRTVQAARGHVTRQLLEELRPVIAGRATKRARKK